MKIDRCFAVRCVFLFFPLVALVGYATAQSKSDKYACSEPNPAQLCNAGNTCGSPSTPCIVDVKRTAYSASSTASIQNAKSNALFCVKPGTTVTWKSTGKDIGFVVDAGPTSPFEPSGTIIDGSDREISVKASKPGCYKYSTGACMSGATSGMCGTANTKLIITAN